ncbi:MAG: methionine--tRNA ligase subunit beta, partial [Lachnospiraceae bacterium]|nr:methionine--tRNA ligase subunit beta [Lachnospiraceae bacterium]
KQVFGHPWLLQGDGKMSKSKGNVIYADDLVKIFGVDPVRYFVLHEMPFENDGVITWELMVERYNSDLVNTLGNLVYRTLSMANKYFGGKVEKTGVTAEVDEDLKRVVASTADVVAEKMDSLRVADALTEIFNTLKRCNKYIDETEPWKLGKNEADFPRLNEVLYNLCDSIMTAAGLLEPFMPGTAAKIAEQLNCPIRSLEDCRLSGTFPASHQLTQTPTMLFMRLKLEDVLEEAEKLMESQKQEAQKAAEASAESAVSDQSGAAAAEEASAAEAPAQEEPAVVDIEAKPEITYDDFAKLQFQVGEIIACEAVKKSRKLLCSQVKIGSQVKQIVSGIKAYYTPEEMVGKKVMVLVNLKPATLAGVVSEGMLLCAEDAEGNLALVTPEKEMPAGAEIC